MPPITINFAEAFEEQRALARRAIDQVRALEESLKGLLPGEDPESGELRNEIKSGLRHLAEIESLIDEQWFRNRASGR